MNQKPKASSPSVNRSVTQVKPPPFHEYFAQLKAEPRKPDEFTLKDLMDSTGLSERVARKHVAEDIKHGRLKVRDANLGSGTAKLYSLTIK